MRVLYFIFRQLMVCYRFFLHLLHAFGSREFLAPLCVLLLQPHRNVGVSGELLMDLALAIAKSETPDFQLLVCPIPFETIVK